jgi:hypothetical protein
VNSRVKVHNVRLDKLPIELPPYEVKTLYRYNVTTPIITFKQPFVDWINEAEPHPGSHRVPIEEVSDDSAAFLIHDYASEEFEGIGHQ